MHPRMRFKGEARHWSFTDNPSTTAVKPTHTNSIESVQPEH